MSKLIKIAAVLLIVGGVFVGPTVLSMFPTQDTVITVNEVPRSGFLRALYNFFYGRYYGE
jgi:hypothetical protein